MRGDLRREDAEGLAALAFARIAADPERLSRFLALTGVPLEGVRASATEPGFLPAVLDHLTGDEDLLVAVAAEIEQRPETLARAAALLSPEADGTP